MNESIFSVKGVISLKDLINFNYETTSKAYLLFNVVLLALLVSQINHEGALLMIILLLGLLCTFPFSIKYKAKKTYEANKSFQSELQYNFCADGINITSAENGTQLLPWDKIYKITISQKCVSFFLAKKQAFLLPKDWFKSEAEIEDFHNLLFAYLPKNKIKRKRFFLF